MDLHKVTVAVITANRKDVLDECIASILKSDHPIFEFIVIDNASTDGTPEMVQEKYPTVKLIRNEKNMGLSFCHNLAMGSFKGDCVFLVDDDNEVEPDMLRKLVDYLYAPENKNIGIVVPLIMEFYDLPEKVVLAGGETSMWSGKNFLCSKRIGEEEIFRDTKRVPNSTLIRREMIEENGYMDDSFFSTLADEDYVRRMNKKGLFAHVILKAVIYHKQKHTSTAARKLGMTNPARAYILARNRTVLIIRYARWYQRIVYLLFWQTLFNAYYLYVLIFKTRRKEFTVAYIKGLFHAWKYVFTKKLPPLEYVLEMTKLEESNKNQIINNK